MLGTGDLPELGLMPEDVSSDLPMRGQSSGPQDSVLLYLHNRLSWCSLVPPGCLFSNCKIRIAGILVD